MIIIKVEIIKKYKAEFEKYAKEIVRIGKEIARIGSDAIVKTAQEIAKEQKGLYSLMQIYYHCPDLLKKLDSERTKKMH